MPVDSKLSKASKSKYDKLLEFEAKYTNTMKGWGRLVELTSILYICAFFIYPIFLYIAIFYSLFIEFINFTPSYI